MSLLFTAAYHIGPHHFAGAWTRRRSAFKPLFESALLFGGILHIQCVSLLASELSSTRGTRGLLHPMLHVALLSSQECLDVVVQEKIPVLFAVQVGENDGNRLC